MAEENLHLPSDTQNIEYHIVTLFEKLDALRRDSACVPLSSVGNQKPPMQVEIRTLEFWRSIISECLASFFYVFIVCGAAVGAGISSSLLATSLAAGFAMATLVQCFGHISGAHVNPAVTAAMAITRNISLLRAAMFITAQCGGGIAGAALLYGVSVPAYQNNLSSVLANTASIPAWERFAVEFILTFMVVFTYFVSMDTYRKWMGSSALAIGASYSACTFVLMPYLNPARSLGPAFVLNKWDNHWVYWIGPMVGGMISGLIYEFIFNPRRHIRQPKESIDGDSSSIHSDEDTYDDLDKPAGPKFHGSTYNTYRPTAATGASSSATGGYCASVASASLYSAPPTKLERVESLYGGTKSLYCKSPPLTRANLNRSQSVYAKSNTAMNRETIPRPGPLVPAQSLYPMRLNQQQSHVQNQNVQNQMQQRTENVYGARPVAPGMATRTEATGAYGNSSANSDRIYGTRNNPSGSSDNPKYEENPKFTRGNRPESMYGMVSGQQRRGGQSAQSDDSSYGSYQGSSTTPRNATSGTVNYSSTAGYNAKGNITGGQSGYTGRQVGGSDLRQSPPTQLLSTVSNSSSFHHNRPQHSPSSQY